MTATHPVRDARTATGSGFTSDGRTIIIYLQPEGKDYAVEFAATFCSVLSQNNPDGGAWDGCDKYLEGAGTGKPASLEPLKPDYHVVIVPGFLSSCFSEAPAFSKGRRARRIQLSGGPNSCTERRDFVKRKTNREVHRRPTNGQEINTHRLQQGRTRYL